MQCNLSLAAENPPRSIPTSAKIAAQVLAAESVDDQYDSRFDVGALSVTTGEHFHLMMIDEYLRMESLGLTVNGVKCERGVERGWKRQFHTQGKEISSLFVTLKHPSKP